MKSAGALPIFAFRWPTLIASVPPESSSRIAARDTRRAAKLRAIAALGGSVEIVWR